MVDLEPDWIAATTFLAKNVHTVHLSLDIPKCTYFGTMTDFVYEFPKWLASFKALRLLTIDFPVIARGDPSGNPPRIRSTRPLLDKFSSVVGVQWRYVNMVAIGIKKETLRGVTVHRTLSLR